MRVLRLAAMAIAATLCLAASPPRANWLATVAVTPSGSHIIGNPKAAVKLTEFVSYTCSHCAHFQQQADAPLGLVYVASGKVVLEIRNFVRDPIDLTAAMLTNCGGPARFQRNHNAFLLGQDKWIAVLGKATAAQQARWSTGSAMARRRAIANDFGFYRIMEQRGYDRPTVDRCLGDEAMAQRIAAQRAEGDRLGVEGTPSFMLNDVLLAGTHDWPSLQAQLSARF